jgi:hypothetical protein
MSSAMMLSALTGAGVTILTGGGWLAYSGAALFERQETNDLIAGFPVIAGLSFIAGSLGICFGAPLPGMNGVPELDR